MLITFVAAYARVVVPAVCDAGPATALLLLAIAGVTLSLLNTSTAIRMFERNRSVSQASHVVNHGRLMAVVLVISTAVALALGVALATEGLWYGNGVLLDCGGKRLLGSADQATGAGHLAVGMVIGIFALLVIGIGLRWLAVRQSRPANGVQGQGDL